MPTPENPSSAPRNLRRGALSWIQSFGIRCLLALASGLNLVAQETWQFDHDDDRTVLVLSADGRLGPRDAEWRVPYASDDQGVLRFSVPEEDGTTTPYEFAVGSSRDLMIGSVDTPSAAHLRVLLRRPATLIRADLAGAWQLVQMEIENRGLGPFRHAFDSFTEPVNLAGNGTFTVPDGRGTWTITANREAAFTLDSETILFSVNAAKDVLISSSATENGLHPLRILVRLPTQSQAVAHLAGTWRRTHLTVSLPGSDQEFRAHNGSAIVDPEGRFTLDGSAARWIVTGPGQARLEPSTQPWIFWQNAGRTLLAAPDLDSAAAGIALFLKTAPATPSDLAGEWVYHALSILRPSVNHRQAEGYRDDGRVVERYEFIRAPDGTRLRDGVSTEFKPDTGEKLFERTYRAGKRHGASREFDPRGRIVTEEVHDDDTLIRRTVQSWGGDTLWERVTTTYVDGAPASEVRESLRPDGTAGSRRETTFTLGLRSLTIELNFHADGTTPYTRRESHLGSNGAVTVEFQTTYRTNAVVVHQARSVPSPVTGELVPDGDQSRFDDDGRPIDRSTFITGRRTRWETLSYWPNGNRSSRTFTEVIDGVEQRDFQSWYESGLLQSEEHTVGSLQEGISRRFAADGSPSSETHYVRGQREGPDRSWLPDGQRTEAVYRQNQLVSHADWSADGRLIRQMYWTNGEPDGVWTEINLNEPRETETHYRAGTLLKRINRWTSDNGILTETTYSEIPRTRLEMAWTADGTLVAREFLLGHDLLGGPDGSSGVREGEFLEPYWVDVRTYAGPRTRAHYRQGFLDGPRVRYAQNGRITENAHYTGGRLDGELTRFGDDGILLYRGEYRDGLLHGVEETFSSLLDASRGRRLTRGHFSAGRREGLFEEWHSSGTLTRSAEYRNDLLDGGSRVYRLPSGTLERQEQYRAGLRDGLATAFDAQGVRVGETTWIAGARNGWSRSWHSIGTPDRWNEYRNDVRHGLSQTFSSSSGRLTAETTYTNDLETGPRLTFHENGETSSVYPLQDRLVHGEVRHFNSNGTLTSRTEYVRDQAHGDHSEYNANGNRVEYGRHSRGARCGTWVRTSAGKETTTQHGTCDGEPAAVVMEIAGLATIAATAEPLGGVSLTVARAAGGGATPGAVTSSGGHFRIPLPVELRQTPLLAVARLAGYQPVTNRIDVQGMSGIVTWNPALTLQSPPGIAQVIPSVAGTHFLDQVRLANRYSIVLQPPLPPFVSSTSYSIFYEDGRPGRPVHIRSVSSLTNALREIDMGFDIAPQARAIRFLTGDSHGTFSPPFDVPLRRYPVPGWSRLLGPWIGGYLPDGRGAYRLDATWPEEPLTLAITTNFLGPILWKAWTNLPVIGTARFGIYDLQTAFSALAHTDGTGEVFAGGTAALEFDDQKVTASVAGEGLLRWGDELTLHKLGIAIGATHSVDRSTPLLRFLPGIKALEDRAVIGPIIAQANQVLTVNHSLAGSVSARLELEDHEGTLRLNRNSSGTFGLRASGEVLVGWGNLLRADSSLAADAVLDWRQTPDGGPQYNLRANLDASVTFSIWDMVESVTHSLQFPPSESGPTLQAADPTPASRGFTLYRNPHRATTARTAPQPAGSRMADAAAPQDGEGTLVADAVHPLTDVAVATDGLTTAIAFVNDDPARLPGQDTDILVSIRGAQGFSQPLPIASDTRADFQPSLAFAADGTLIAAWVTARTPDFTGTTLESRAAASEIAWSARHPVSGQWSEPIRLTDNAHLDHSPVLIRAANGQVQLLWQSNASNALQATPAQPTTLWFTVWTGSGFETPSPIPGGLANAWAPSVASDGNTTLVVTTVDLDGQLTTPHDQEIVVRRRLQNLNGRWLPPEQLTHDERIDRQPTVLCTGTNRFELFWLKDDAVVRLLDWTDHRHQVLQPSGASDLAAGLGSSGRLHIAWNGRSATNASTSQWRVRLHEPDPIFPTRDGTWSDPIALTPPATGRTTARLAQGPGPLVLIHGRRFQSGGPIRIHALEPDPDPDLAISPSDIDLPSPLPAGSQSLQLGVRVRNAGLTSASLNEVRVYSDDPAAGGTLLQTTTVSAFSRVILPGAHWESSILVPPPAAGFGPALHVVAVPNPATPDRFPGNNQAPVPLRHPDPAAERLGWAPAPEGALVLTSWVTNRGRLATGRLTARLSNDTAELASWTIESLAPGASLEHPVTIPGATAFPIGTNTDTGTFTLRIEPMDAVGDADPSNNRRSIALTRPPAGNLPPRLAPIPTLRIPAGAAWLKILEADDDATPRASLLFEKITGPAGLSLTSDGVIAFVPPAWVAGQSFAVELRVSDGELASSLSFTIEVTDPVQPIELPRLELAARPDGGWLLRIRGSRDGIVTLETTTDPGTAWEPLSTISTSGFETPVDLPLTPTGAARFYRLRQP